MALADNYQSPVYGSCAVQLASGTRLTTSGYLLIPLDGSDAYFHPYNGAAPVKCPIDNPPKWASDNPFYPFYPNVV